VRQLRVEAGLKVAVGHWHGEQHVSLAKLAVLTDIQQREFIPV
jgi:hypothetical protein